MSVFVCVVYRKLVLLFIYTLPLCAVSTGCCLCFSFFFFHFVYVRDRKSVV